MRSCRASPRGIARSRVKPASLRPFISIGARVAGSNGERTARILFPRFVSTPRPMNREFLVLHRRFKSESSCRIYRETIASLTGAMMLFLPRESSVPSVPLLFSFFFLVSSNVFFVFTSARLVKPHQPVFTPRYRETFNLGSILFDPRGSSRAVYREKRIVKIRGRMP